MIKEEKVRTFTDFSRWFFSCKLSKLVFCFKVNDTQKKERKKERRRREGDEKGKKEKEEEWGEEE